MSLHHRPGRGLGAWAAAFALRPHGAVPSQSRPTSGPSCNTPSYRLTPQASPEKAVLCVLIQLLNF